MGSRGGGVVGSDWGEGQGGCERRTEVYGKIHKKKIGGSCREGGGSGGGSGWWGGGVSWVDVNAMLVVGGDVGYGGSEPRIEGIVQCTKRYCTILRKLKKMRGGGGGGVGGAIFEPKTLSMYLKKEKEKN